MTVYTLVLSNSTVTETATGLRYRHDVQQDRPLPIGGTVTLISATVIHLKDDPAVYRPILQVVLPWLSSSASHIVAGSANATSSAPDATALSADKKRFATNGLYIPTLSAVSHIEMNEEYNIPDSVLPARYTAEILDIDGQPYSNVSTLILTFKIRSKGFIA